ncbi:hypothetical protein ADK67_40305 [Saccharothrix sp. NRRL B-16348]|uniref:hypothetical protein n=1 Tax=Saccharothrix sp. NRRL B-16348 TaxID=1415542 RepID=UPI0006AEDA5C|nr:hypothetical protein [Saccharothrix sp. NRRL B-16348]KOX16198.1 hypothetical protein ADK67_40305 [Saccharothrix sp. NRRL B-16348]
MTTPTWATWSNRPEAAAAMDMPTPGGTEPAARFRAALVREAGAPSAVPLPQQLARLLESWAGPTTVSDDNALLGELDGQVMRITATGVLDLLRRHNLAPQLGVTPTTADAEAAVTLATGHARVEQERRVVAEEHLARRQRAELLEDAELAAKRAGLLRALADLDGPPPSAPAGDPPGRPRRRWRG